MRGVEESVRREYHITKKVITKILAQYGGRRKYKLSEKFSVEKDHQIVFMEKTNKHKWLSMTARDGGVMVTLTDETGRIIQRDFYTTDGERREVKRWQ